MKKILHSSMEIQYDSFEELNNDLIKLKEKKFDIIDGYENYYGKWRLNVIYTHSESMEYYISMYGKCKDYIIKDKNCNIVLKGNNIN